MIMRLFMFSVFGREEVDIVKSLWSAMAVQGYFHQRELRKITGMLLAQ